MKAQFTITVDVDTEDRSETIMRVVSDDLFKVYVGRNAAVAPGSTERDKVLGGVLHEIGHAIAIGLSLPGAMGDIRNPNRKMMSRQSMGEGILLSEREAWDLADKIFQVVKHDCLADYQLAWQPLTHNPTQEKI